MILQCYTVWNSITTFLSMRGLMGTCSRSFCSERINLLSLSKRDGVSQEEFTSMEITVLCHLRRHIRFYQMPVFDKMSPSLHYSSLSSYLWPSISHVFKKLWLPSKNLDVQVKENWRTRILPPRDIFQVHETTTSLKFLTVIVGGIMSVILFRCTICYATSIISCDVVHVHKFLIEL